MSAKFEDAIRISLDAYAKKRANLTKVLGNEAVNHFKDGWRKQGWDDNVVAPWKARKGQLRSGIAQVSRKSDSSRAILVKSGRLRRSFYMSVEGSHRVIVVNPTPYSVYHNYGTKRLPQRKFMGKSRNLDEKSGVLISRMIKSALR